jgi:hypothetical protein
VLKRWVEVKKPGGQLYKEVAEVGAASVPAAKIEDFASSGDIVPIQEYVDELEMQFGFLKALLTA